MSTFIEVCSGAGGLSLGLIKAGFTPLLLNEIDKTCCDTLKKNHSNLNIIQGDMKEINLDMYKAVDLLCGGVPCQSFSQAGKRKGLEDPRGDLILIFGKLVEQIKPKIFLIENVAGLLNQKNINQY